MKWRERECNSTCYPQPCSIHIHASNSSHIVAEFPQTELSYLKTKHDFLGYVYNYSIMTIVCQNSSGMTVFDINTRGNLSMAPIWCLGNNLVLQFDMKQSDSGLFTSRTMTSFNMILYLNPVQKCFYVNIGGIKLECKHFFWNPPPSIPQVFMCDRVVHVRSSIRLLGKHFTRHNAQMSHKNL